MKTIITLLLTTFVTLQLSAQNFIERYYQDEQLDDRFTIVHVSAKMFELAGHIEWEAESEEERDIQSILDQIHAFDLVAAEDVSDAQARYNKAVERAESSYEMLMRVDDKQGHVSFYIDENNGIVQELVIAGAGDQKFGVISVTGEMNLRELSRLASKIHSKSFETMRLMDEHQAVHIEVYPNPTSAGQDWTLKAPENFVGGQAHLYDIKGQLIRQIDIDSEVTSIPTSDLSSSTYILEVVNEGVTVKKKLIVEAGR